MKSDSRHFLKIHFVEMKAKSLSEKSHIIFKYSILSLQCSAHISYLSILALWAYFSLEDDVLLLLLFLVPAL